MDQPAPVRRLRAVQRALRLDGAARAAESAPRTIVYPLRSEAPGGAGGGSASPQQGSPLAIDTLVPPPPWALLQRELLRAQSEGCAEFYEKYIDDRGWLRAVPRWGALDGPDDAIENLANWPLLYLLGGDGRIVDWCKKAYDGHIEQYTEAKTVEVEFARDGMYYKEFPVYSDWAHHAEGLVVLGLQPLMDPTDQRTIQRLKRFAGFYMGEDPQADNWDAEHRVIRSMFNGSRGPMLRKTTPLDWCGDPLEDGRFLLLHGQQTYAEMLARFEVYADVAGAHPLNLTSTGLAFNAFAMTGEGKYRDWLLDYASAWVDRVHANGGVIPSNIGLDGEIGGECGGRWWGGTYGWAHSVHAPRFGKMDYFTLNAVNHAVDGPFRSSVLLAAVREAAAVLTCSFAHRLWECAAALGRHEVHGCVAHEPRQRQRQLQDHRRRGDVPAHARRRRLVRPPSSGRLAQRSSLCSRRLV